MEESMCVPENNKKIILMTGATGFVGRHFMAALRNSDKFTVRVAVRNTNSPFLGGCEEIISIPDISTSTNWSDALKNCDVVVHAAARVHVMKEEERAPLLEYRRINVEGTLHLAHQAAKNGVKRFIYISSIKVNGEETKPGTTYSADDIPAPEDPYALSKYEAEQGLLKLSDETGMQVIIIRPPLVYGPGVGGNFQRMIKWLQKGYPLPLKTINNKRSFVSVYNLVDLIIHCLDASEKNNQIFLVSDNQDVSTPELLQKVALALNKPARLIPFPYWILKNLASIAGKKPEVQRLCGSLQVDVNKTQELLGWKPKMSIDEALAKTIQDYA
ncbi:UDP-glucose 4-epimerase family protein [Legionella hackeliae]|uniref:UDP-glucose 4-epimerase n=1 Tax=Legionella hackeliae TaxID=449 RepID=A0A0A8UT32_LEGHA|nr:SDR family oxidoreductase [Legionella hackeliae]KTD08814.1 UDP-glucose 4-epimerase [Legionella hackeliae]CEK10242.1 UDP-glucose 4-epimerase [Legionella hackeliae]STX46971.1 UDP-glucose 4-epimerase (Galactowaldenase) (UDP-galactose 4-epimerase) [Legionella hackeliae]